MCVFSGVFLMRGSEMGGVSAFGREKMERQRKEENQADSSCVCSLPAIVRRGFSLERENSST